MVTERKNDVGRGNGAASARVLALRSRLEPLIAEVASFWWPRAADPVHGGFYGILDRAGRPDVSAEKTIVQQARHLWSLATWIERRPASSELHDLAEGTRAFIARAFYDPARREYHYACTHRGEVSDARKLLYGQSFAIYALSTYGRVVGRAESVEAALQCFEAIDARAHDDLHLGYDQRDDPHWMTGGCRKDTNTHIHLLEAYTELYDTTADPRVGARLLELAQVIATRVVQPQGYAHQRFERDFTPIGPALVSYGHDIETCWLLFEALRALRMFDETIERAALQIGRTAAREGADPVLGGFFDAGVPGDVVTSFEKIWWAQFEALCGLWRLFAVTRDVRYLDQLARTLAWVEGPGHDPEHGEWFYGVMPDGSLGPAGDLKGSIWKATYHNLRALLYVHGWMTSWLEPQADSSA